MTVEGAPKSREAWAFVRQMLDDMTAMVERDAETELELLEGFRVLGRVTALCAELSLDIDPAKPWFFDMNSPARYVGGPAPDGEYLLAMIDTGAHAYRVSGDRGTSAYLGFQLLAGRGLTPRRMAAYVSDRDLDVADDGRFSFVLAAVEPSPEVLAGDPWIEVPDDGSAIVVREYIGDRATERLADLTIAALEVPGPPPALTDEVLAEQLTTLAWTIAKLATLHQSIKPELLTMPNQLLTEEAAALGDAESTPDNLYVIGTFRLQPDEALVIDLHPPETRFWCVSLENVWHECIEPRRRQTSVTNAAVVPDEHGVVRIVVAGEQHGIGTWLDTGGRHRGFVLVRWLDNPAPPAVETRVVRLVDLDALGSLSPADAGDLR